MSNTQETALIDKLESVVQLVSQGSVPSCFGLEIESNFHCSGQAEGARINFDEQIANWWQRASEFQMDDPRVVEPFTFVLRQELQWDEEFTALAICEYKKFMLLCRLYDDMTPSVDVDTVWHLHLLYTMSYQRFCRTALDCDFLHHEPSSGGSAAEEQNNNAYQQTLARYVEVFGSEPPLEIWAGRIRTDAQ